MAAEGYSARALAELGLPGLGGVRAVQLRAKAEGWPFESRAVRGGTCAWYPIEGLPAELRAAIEARRPELDRQDSEPTQAHLEIARTRLELVARLDRELAAGVELSVALAAIAADAKTSSRTLRRWWDSVRELPRTAWLEALTPSWRGRGGQAGCDERAFAFFRDDYLRGSKPSFRAVYRRTVKVAAERSWSPVPSLDAMRARLEREVPFEVRVLRREGPKAAAALYPAQERERTHFGALEAVNADGHRFDVRVRWPGGEIERPMMVAFQDLASGKILGWRIDKTESADLVRLAFADVVSRYGVPEQAYLDNGRGFASKWITGRAAWRHRFKVKDEDPVGVMNAVGVREIHWTTPYHGQSKPIERAFGDLCESIAKHPLCEGAYTGRSPLHKPHDYGTRAVELADFVALVEAQIPAHNAQPDREGAFARGRSFDAIFAELYERGPVARASEAQQRMLLLSHEKVRVRQGTGCVFLAGNRYWDPALAPLQGQDVVLRFDPQDLHGSVYVYRLDGSYLCAADCQAPVGFNDTTAAREHARSRKAYVRAIKAQAKAQQEFTARELAELHLGSRLPERLPAPKVLKPVFGAPVAPKREAELPAESDASRSLLAEIRADALARVADLRRND